MKKITLSNSEIQTYFGKYTEYSTKAVNSKDSEDDLKAAYYAPILLLQGSSDFNRFEETMDKVLFHLDRAYDKSLNDDMETRVGLSAQILLEFHITLIELKLRESSRRLGWEFFTTLLTSATTIVSNLYKNDKVGLSNDFSKLFSACVSFFIITKIKKNEKERFYEQLIKVYRKVLNSPVYSKQYDLVKNSFIRIDSNELLLRCLHKDGFATTEDLLRKFGFRPDEIGVFLRRVFNDLTTNSTIQIDVAHEDLIKIRKKIQSSKIPNQYELDEIIFKLFKTKNIPRSLRSQGLSQTLIYIKEFGETNHEVNELLINLIQNVTLQTRMSDFVEILVFSKENYTPLMASTIKEELLKIYDQKFSPHRINLTKYKLLVFLFAPILCLGSLIIGWKSESTSSLGQNMVTSFFNSLWQTSVAVVPFILGLLLLVYGVIILIGFAINSSRLREHKKNVIELDKLLNAKN